MSRPPHAVLNPWPGDLVFERPVVEHLYDEDYRAVVASLEAEGWEVREVQSFEEQPIREVVEVFWRLLQDFEDDALKVAAGVLIRELIARLRKPRRAEAPKRLANIYKANGEIYTTVDLDEPVDE